MRLTADIDLTARDIVDLASVDAIASFLTRLGYPTNRRSELTATALGLTGDTPEAIRNMEVLSEDDEQLFRVVFVQLRSLTAKARNDIARNLGRRSADHLLILTRDFETLEFVLIDKQTRQRNVPGGGPSVQIIPRVVTVIRKSSTQLNRRILRRLTWTGRDGLDQFDKLRSVFEAAHYTGTYFQNRALFADHYLEHRLRDDPAWRDNPTEAFSKVRDLMRDARSRLHAKDEQVARDGLFDPIWKLLGFSAKVNKAAHQDHLEPDYVLNAADGSPFVPLFPELRTPLLALFGAAEPGTEYVIVRNRLGGMNLRTQFERIIGRTGAKTWPRLFHNLRGSRETELMREYDLATVCKWIGNSPAVAAKHYASSVDLNADFKRAAALPDATPEKAQQKAQQSAAERVCQDAPTIPGDGSQTLENTGNVDCGHPLAVGGKTGGWAIQDSNL